MKHSEMDVEKVDVISVPETPGESKLVYEMLGKQMVSSVFVGASENVEPTL